jgi:hypothetical protein
MAPKEKVHIKRDEAATERTEPPSAPDVQPEGPGSVEERRLVRKLDRRILPITCLMYLFACQYPRRSMSAFFTHYYVTARPGQK